MKTAFQRWKNANIDFTFPIPQPSQHRVGSSTKKKLRQFQQFVAGGQEGKSVALASEGKCFGECGLEDEECERKVATGSWFFPPLKKVG